MKKEAPKYGFDGEGGDLDVLDGIRIPGQEAPDFAAEGLLFRLALLNEMKKLKENAEDNHTHGLAVQLSETLVKDALG